ncbi:vacuolar sorting protein, Vps52/Sac2 family protein [Rhodotorula toruloides]|uniref:Vacuolar sorting protein, Vps52/Sac2 family protein n=1 Tax=Rhodotorula toruloides TaxID=5286 RepID=A0A511K763_RHOTO|nr:vacuolar sorting protein, Vps52/Sac2 family protein [Rhodotorula toruloides]
MASVAQLIGWDSRTHSSQHALAHLDTLDPDNYPAYAVDAKGLGRDIRTAYADELTRTEEHEKEQDRAFLERAREFVELDEQVETSTQLLTELSAFLSTFQHDLSAAVERSLHPFVSSIAISPSLITTILDSDVAAETWIPAVRELDAKLGAIRGGARVESRKSLDDVAEALRVAASNKILAYLVPLLKPYTTSVQPSLPSLHSTLLRLKPLFDFLRRYAARQAHEFQKAYVQTTRWFYETGFRRYVRALEGVRTSKAAVAVVTSEPIGSVSSGADALALLNQRRTAPASSLTSPAQRTPTSTALENAQVEGPPIIIAHMASDRNLHPSPESLFRSISLVLASNASSEYVFLASFFGSNSTLNLRPPMSRTGTQASERALRRSTTSGSLASATSAAVPPDVDENGRAGTPSVTGSAATAASRDRQQDEKAQRATVDVLWKGVMDPALEYSRNFVNALLDPTPPSSISLFSMIRLNDVLLSLLVPSSLSTTESSATSPPSPFPPCPSIEPHLIAIRMQLWPSFAKVMSHQIDSLRRINGSISAAASGVGGMLSRATGGGGASVKDSVVKVIVGRYCEMFNAFVALVSVGQEAAGAAGTESDDEMAFSSLLRVRQELDKLLSHQASKIPDPAKQRVFLRKLYEEVLQGLSAGMSSHSRTQAEVAHYRELARKAA